MKPDRFLMGILAGIGLLVALALALFFLRRGSQAYGPEDSPSGVVRNYILAVTQGDYERAYRYLAEGENKPTYAVFTRAFLTQQIDPASTAVQIGETLYTSKVSALVDLILIHAGSGPFDESYREPFQAVLVLDTTASAWKIERMPYPYWAFDWYTPQSIPAKPLP
jgi:hypothetical protein